MRTYSSFFDSMTTSVILLFIFQALVPTANMTAGLSSSDVTDNRVNAAYVSVTKIDINAAGFTITPLSGLETSEDGGTATFTVALTSQPKANVSIYLSSSDTTEGIPSPTSLTFTPSNWSTAKTVTVIGRDDAVDDGTIYYTIITSRAHSNDSYYNRLNPPDVAAYNLNNDTAGIFIDPISGLVTTEAGGTASFTVVLSSQPTSDVTLSLGSSDTTEGTVSLTSLNFTPDNWNINQSVTITGVDDGLVDGDTAYTVVTAPASSADGKYNGLDAPDVAVTNLDNDVMPIAVDDSYMTDEDIVLTIASPGVMLNDTFNGNVGATTQLESDVSHGTLNLESDGSLEYTPAANYNGLDYFTYRIRNGEFTSNAATVTITINPINDPPVAVADRYDTNATYDTPLIVEAPGVLINDSDVDNGEILTVELVTRPMNGALILNPNGSFTYRPNPRFNGLDMFTYQVSDGELKSNTGEVRIYIDTYPPAPVLWISPVDNGEIYHVKGEIVSLQVNTDPQDTDIDRVQFYRWDPKQMDYFVISNVTQAPYQADFDTRLLVPGWNQIFARAYDKAGNASERRFIWLIRENPNAQFLPILKR